VALTDPIAAPTHPKQVHDGSSERATAVLWVGFPTGLRVGEEQLVGAFRSCGGLERVRTFDDRSYAFVIFRTVEAAVHAKSVMQARALEPPPSAECASADARPLAELPDRQRANARQVLQQRHHGSARWRSVRVRLRVCS